MNSFQQGLSALVAQHAGQLPCDALMRAAESLVSAEESQPTEGREGYTKRVLVEHFGHRFIDLGDSVEDRQTKLIWTKATLDVGKVDFKAAERAVTDLSLGDFKAGAWRLPTIRELLTLVDYERHDPAIDPIFEAKSDYYWTNSPAAASPAGCAWIVNFNDGCASWSNRGNHAFVRAVRPSQ